MMMITEFSPIVIQLKFNNRINNGIDKEIKERIQQINNNNNLKQILNKFNFNKTINIINDINKFINQCELDITKILGISENTYINLNKNLKQLNQLKQLGQSYNETDENLYIEIDEKIESNFIPSDLKENLILLKKNIYKEELKYQEEYKNILKEIEKINKDIPFFTKKKLILSKENIDKGQNEYKEKYNKDLKEFEEEHKEIFKKFQNINISQYLKEKLLNNNSNNNKEEEQKLELEIFNTLQLIYDKKNSLYNTFELNKVESNINEIKDFKNKLFNFFNKNILENNNNNKNRIMGEFENQFDFLINNKNFKSKENTNKEIIFNKIYNELSKL